MAKRSLVVETVGCRPRVSVQGGRRSFASKIIDGLSGKNNSYDALPEEPINLNVLKLDGSSFDIQVMKMATVEELKMAVEDVFSYLPKKGPGKISWPHLWGQFCLCYGEHKLLTDTDYISNYGVRDGDQLHFIRHVSNVYIASKRKKKRRNATSTKQKGALSDSIISREKNTKIANRCVKGYPDKECGSNCPGKVGFTIISRSKLSFLTNIPGVLFSYKRVPKDKRKRQYSHASTRRQQGNGFVWGLRNFIRLYRRKSLLPKLRGRSSIFGSLP